MVNNAVLESESIKGFLTQSIEYTPRNDNFFKTSYQESIDNFYYTIYQYNELSNYQ